MATIEELRESAEKISKMTSELSHHLGTFQRKNQRQISRADKMLKSTSTGADQQVAQALGEASKAISRARRDLDEAANAARDYGQKL